MSGSRKSNMIEIGFGLRLHTWLALPIMGLLLLTNSAGLALANATNPNPVGLPEVLGTSQALLPPTDNLMPSTFQDYAATNLAIHDLKDITDIVCFRKTVGMNKGTDCIWEGVKHFMKLETPDKQRLLEFYNIAFVKQTLGVIVPKAEFVMHKDQLYLSKEEIPLFKAAKSFYDRFKYTLTEPESEQAKTFRAASNRAYLRQKIVPRIGGEAELAKVIVGTMLVGDLTLENWGFTNKKPVFMDVDGGKTPEGLSKQPKTMLEYLDLARSTILHDPYRFDLSLRNLQDMKNIFDGMLDKVLPDVHPEVNMSREFYEMLIRTFSKVCSEAMSQIVRARPDQALDKIDEYHNYVMQDLINEQIKFFQSIKDEPRPPVQATQPEPQTKSQQKPKKENYFNRNTVALGVIGSAATLGLFTIAAQVRGKKNKNKKAASLPAALKSITIKR